MTSTAFTPDAARALDGPAWLAERRAAAAEHLATLEWPTSSEEIWRYSRIDDIDLAKYKPVDAETLGAPGDERAPGGGPLAAEAGERAVPVVVRDGRVVHSHLDEALERKGVRVRGIATCEEAEVREWLGVCSDASPDASTVLHDAFLAGGAFVHVPAGVVDRPIVVLHRAEGDGLASFPHPLVVAEESSEVTVVDRFSSSAKDHLVDAVVELHVAAAARVRYLSIQDHGPSTWHVALQRAHVADDASLRSSAVSDKLDHLHA